MKGYRSTIEKRELTDNLIHKIQITTDEESLFLVVEYMDGRFIIEKNFKNNYIGLEAMNQTCEKFDTEEKIKQYLGIGE